MATLLAGRYRIGERVGAGGSAHVFRAHDERLDREVAVKILDEAAAESADPVARRRFSGEARNAATFTHPNAVTIFDAGSDQGQLFLVMELLEGGSLAQRLASAGPMENSAVRRLGSQIGGALAAAHAAGIIHRDVKPSNVLLSDDETSKLADFGIARRFEEIEESLTSTGMVMGTRHYVSPEQAAGRSLTPATDIYSLGVTLFEAATGVRPPPATDRLTNDLLDPRSISRGIDSALATTISKATARAVGDRFESMPEMVRSLATATAEGAPGSPVVAETATMPADLDPSTDAAGPDRQSPHEMSQQLVDERRRRRLAILLVTAVAVLIAGLFVFVRNQPDDGPAAGVPSAGTAPSTAASADTTTSDTAAATTTAEPSAVDPATSNTAPTEPTTGPATTPGPAPTTEPAATPTPSTAPELIPGFAAPASVEEFLATLERQPDLSGPRGDDLAKELDKLLDADADDREQDGDRLRDKIDKWLDKNEIDPTIAITASDFVDQLTP